jgi:hypothetical protein
MNRQQLESAGVVYSTLRGLLQLPAGALCVLAALSNLNVGPLSHTWVFPVCALVAGGAFLLILRSYQDTYGRVRPSTRMRAKVAAASAVSVVAAGAAVTGDWRIDLPLSFTATAFGLILLVNYAVTSRISIHHVVVFGALSAAGLIPLWGDASPDVRINAGLALAGAAIMVAGLFDHHVLKHTFGTPTSPNRPTGLDQAGGLNPGNNDAGA